MRIIDLMKMKLAGTPDGRMVKLSRHDIEKLIAVCDRSIDAINAETITEELIKAVQDLDT